jgi:hypothetical protein
MELIENTVQHAYEKMLCSHLRSWFEACSLAQICWWPVTGDVHSLNRYTYTVLCVCECGCAWLQPKCIAVVMIWHSSDFYSLVFWISLPSNFSTVIYALYTRGSLSKKIFKKNTPGLEKTDTYSSLTICQCQYLLRGVYAENRAVFFP